MLGTTAYLSLNRVQHTGRWHGGRIRSKWGQDHTWDHALHEVPLSYGDVVRLFRALPGAEAVAVYVGFAREVDPSLRPAVDGDRSVEVVQDLLRHLYASAPAPITTAVEPSSPQSPSCGSETQTTKARVVLVSPPRRWRSS